MSKLTEEQLRFLLLRTIGNFLVLSSLFAMFLSFGPAVKNELVYRYGRLRGIRYEVKEAAVNVQPVITPSITPTEERGFFGNLTSSGSEIRTLTPVDTDFGIIIPKIAANARIIPDVDASNYDLYMKALSIGVAHAQGTKFPGEGGNVYLFAHSTDNFWNVGRYNAIFYLLKELGVGDEIDVFYQGHRFIYQVSKREIVEPDNVKYLVEPTISERVTMQTCWPPGTTLKRLVVIAKPKEN